MKLPFSLSSPLAGDSAPYCPPRSIVSQGEGAEKRAPHCCHAKVTLHGALLGPSDKRDVKKKACSGRGDTGSYNYLVIKSSQVRQSSDNICDIESTKKDYLI